MPLVLQIFGHKVLNNFYLMKSQRIIKVITILPEWDINACAKCRDNPSNSREISLKAKNVNLMVTQAEKSVDHQSRWDS